jgi:YD repeat-containing protein
MQGNRFVSATVTAMSAVGVWSPFGVTARAPGNEGSGQTTDAVEADQTWSQRCTGASAIGAQRMTWDPVQATNHSSGSIGQSEKE